jgi:hypothetical protein
VSVSVELVRTEWDDGRRRLEAARDDPRRYEQLLAQVNLVGDELRKRVGQSYTLAELAVAYHEAEPWARELIAERAPTPGWPRDLSLVVAAAFHSYQRGATDYLS